MDSHCPLSRCVALDQLLDPSLFLGLEKNANIDLKEVLGDRRKLLQVKNNSRNVMFLDCSKCKPRKHLLRGVYLTLQVRGRSGSLKLAASIGKSFPLGKSFPAALFQEESEQTRKDRIRGTKRGGG